jgi:hypothetical protein
MVPSPADALPIARGIEDQALAHDNAAPSGSTPGFEGEEAAA